MEPRDSGTRAQQEETSAASRRTVGTCQLKGVTVHPCPCNLVQILQERLVVKRINQTEIAQATGVSVSTVSRVLSNAPGISEPVRAKVMSAARDLGYRFTLPGMARGRTLSRVVLFVGQMRTPSGLGLVYNSILAGIRNVAETSGIAVHFALQDADGELPNHILNEQDAGFLFLGIDPSIEVLRALRARDVPVVLVNGQDPEMLVDTVAPANFAGGRLVARHLVERGHSKVLLLTSEARWTLKRRGEGVRSGLAEFAGERAETRTVQMNGLAEEHVYATKDQWLPAVEDGFRAIFCGNDLVGLAAMQVLKGLGYLAPEHVAIIGFDDFPVAEMADPPLSTIKIDWEGIGAEAMRLASLRHADPESPHRQVQLGAHLIPRRST